MTTIAPVITRSTFVLTAQNGVEAPDIAAEKFGRERVLVGTFRTTCDVLEPGVVRHLGGRVVQLGALEGPDDSRAHALAPAFGPGAEVPADIRFAMWDKMTAMSVLNGLGALADVPVGVLGELPELAALTHQAMVEVVSVGRACGIVFPPGYEESRLGRTPWNRGTMFSTQRDLRAGRPSELDAQITAVVRLGAQKGVPTPLFRVIVAALLPREMRARGRLSY